MSQWYANCSWFIANENAVQTSYQIPYVDENAVSPCNSR